MDHGRLFQNGVRKRLIGLNRSGQSTKVRYDRQLNSFALGHVGSLIYRERDKFISRQMLRFTNVLEALPIGLFHLKARPLFAPEPKLTIRQIYGRFRPAFR